MIKLIAKLKWIRQGKPMLHYEGFNCGCCGKYWSIPFDVPEYKSNGKWWDTWGICPKYNLKGCQKNYRRSYYETLD